jgi:hypothetical protein
MNASIKDGTAGMQSGKLRLKATRTMRTAGRQAGKYNLKKRTHLHKITCSVSLPYTSMRDGTEHPQSYSNSPKYGMKDRN